MGAGKHAYYLMLTPTETKESGIPTTGVCPHLVETMSMVYKNIMEHPSGARAKQHVSSTFEGSF